MDLIPAPDLEIRDEEQLAAEAIARTSGGLTAGIVASQIEERRRLLAMIESGAIGVDTAICPELTNANPSAPHTVQLEAMGWLLGQMGFRINQIPSQNEIEFANLFKVGIREASPATTILEFSVAPPDGVDVNVPAGTRVSTDDGSVIFETAEGVLIPSGQSKGQAPARNVAVGAFLLAQDLLTRMVDPIAWVDGVTNPEAIDGGGMGETIAEALERARSYQRRGERLVSTLDFEEAILSDVLRGNGIVRGFPFVVQGAFSGPARPGHTTFVVMTRNGLPVTASNKLLINSIIQQAIGNQFVYISDPIYVSFNVTASVRLTSSSPQSIEATKKAIETNLRSFYAPDRENFGRPILRAEVIALIEGTQNVDRIVSDVSGPILASPQVDVKLQPWELPKIVTVTVTTV